jgi:uncharacterized protein HemY
MWVAVSAVTRALTTPLACLQAALAAQQRGDLPKRDRLIDEAMRLMDAQAEAEKKIRATLARLRKKPPGEPSG